MSNLKRIKFPILAVLSLVAIFSVAAIVSSQELYPPPTDLVVEAGPEHSGYIRLQWKKPSDEVIGYQLARSVPGRARAMLLDTGEDLIGADSTIYFDTDIAAGETYWYYVWANYVGGSSTYTKSTTVVAPDYCPTSCVDVSPLVAGPGTRLLDFGNRRLIPIRSVLQLDLRADPIPAGRYQISIYSYDSELGRSSETETNERWYLVFYKELGGIIAQTALTSDLRDGVEAAGQVEVIETEFVLPEPAAYLYAYHANYLNRLGLDPVYVSNIALTDMATGFDKCLLVVEKATDKTKVSFGDELTYTITVRNDGGANCTGGGNYIYDYVPEGLEYVSETHTGNVDIARRSGQAYDPATRQLWWVATTPLVPGEVAVVTWTGRVVAGNESPICDGDNVTADVIENRAYVTNAQYAARTIPVRSNTNVITCEPPPEPEIEATVTAFPNPSYLGDSVTWTATPFGECPGPFSYSWTGDDGLMGNTASVVHIYNNAGSYNATVTVTAPGCQPLTKTSPTPVVIIEQFAPDSVSCSATPQVAQVGKPVSWRAIVSPPVPPEGGDYSFSWSGDDGLSGTGPSITKTYDSIGVKNATVLIGGGVQESASCSVTVKVRARPRYEEI